MPDKDKTYRPCFLTGGIIAITHSSSESWSFAKSLIDIGVQEGIIVYPVSTVAQD